MAELDLIAGIVLVDDDDLERLRRDGWWASLFMQAAPSDNCRWSRYVRCARWNHQENRPEYAALHRLLVDAPLGFHVDHANGNPLDNRRCNLRIVTPRQNSWNRRPRKNAASRFKGVTQRRGKWRARITIHGVRKELGQFDREEDAAMAYNRAAKEYFGEYARLNDLDHQ